MGDEDATAAEDGADRRQAALGEETAAAPAVGPENDVLARLEAVAAELADCGRILAALRG